MRIIFTFFTCLLLCLPISAQVLLNEDFEHEGEYPSGWTFYSENEDSAVSKPWEMYGVEDSSFILSGLYSLYLNRSYAATPPIGKEYAITPEITLPEDESYGVSFLWQSNFTYTNGNPNQKCYDFQLAVQVVGSDNWEVLWSVTDREALEKSGVAWPWSSWTTYTSTVSLDDYKGKKVKLAFVYDYWGALCNIAIADNVKVEPHTNVNGPIIEGSTSYVFVDSYLNLKEISDNQELYIQNKGIGSLEILAIEGLEGTDFSTNLAPGVVSLAAQDLAYYNVYYTPTEDGNRSVKMTIKTNGGDWEVNLSGTKQMLDEGYTIESFETPTFYPAGWTGSGFELTNQARSGNKAVSPKVIEYAELRSPRLDLSTGSYTVTFDLQTLVNEQGSTGPMDDFRLEMTKNGGNSWIELWYNDVWTNLRSTPYQRITVEIKNPFSDNVYLRWVYAIEGELNLEMESQLVYLDNIVLPPLYGSKLPPVAVEKPTPADASVDQNAPTLELSWRGVLHAEEYKIYLGTNEANPTSVLNGVSVSGDIVSYLVTGLDYNQTYYWKVIPSNTNGSPEDVATWSFTTMKDMTIRNFPYFEGFEDDNFPPLGWTLEQEGSGNKGWSKSNIGAYNGNYSLAVYTTEHNREAIIKSANIEVPAQQDIQISFVWGNTVPNGLSKSLGIPQTEGGDTIYFEVKGNDGIWKTEAICSQEGENKKWERCKVVLSEYKGQTINVRWRYSVENWHKAGRGALDDIEIEYVSDLGVPYISFTEWYAGKIMVREEWNAGIVNYQQILNSGEIFTLENRGEYNLKIKEISFETGFFTSTLTVGQEIKANEQAKFGIIFSGVSPEGMEEIKDNMKITFEDNQTYTFPIKGSAMNQYSYCYTFDNVEAFATNNIYDFKIVDKDNFMTIGSSAISFPGESTPYAFMVMNWEKADWRNLFPRSGQQLLMAANGSGNDYSRFTSDWLITKTMSPKENAQVRFYAKSYGAKDDYNSFEPHKLSVLVSTTDNNPNSFVPTDFTQVDMPCDPRGGEYYKECIVDLSKYAGQKIYIAIHHEVKDGYFFFLDDLYFENFNGLSTPGDGVPVFASEPILTGQVGKEYNYSFTVLDPDGDHLDIVVHGPSWMTHTLTDNGGTLSGTPNAAGEHFVLIEASDGKNTAKQQFYITVSGGDALDDISSSINIHPNPVNETIYIDGVEEAIFTLTDLSGQVVYRDVNVRKIPVDNLAAGIYLLRVDAQSGTFTTKIIKK